MLSVSTIIPHAGGKVILIDCLKSLFASKGVELEVIIVQNGPIDDIDDDVLETFPGMQVLRFACNLGFAGACNKGVDAARNELVFLLNNDAVVEENSIHYLAERLVREPSIAACQPKIRSLIEKGKFDYSSACGGEIDRYGYPFARGRVFETVEFDRGQYDTDLEIFWGAGAALLLKRSLYNRVGGLDERYFAHMEEIDLLWRIRLIGYRTFCFPGSVVWHRGATTIRSGSFSKYYLNHRNSLATIFKNYSFASLCRFFPVRLILDLVLLLYSILLLDFVRCRAVLSSLVWFAGNLPYLIISRIKVQKIRKVPEREVIKYIFPESIVWQYFVKNKRTWDIIRGEVNN